MLTSAALKGSISLIILVELEVSGFAAIMVALSGILLVVVNDPDLGI